MGRRGVRGGQRAGLVTHVVEERLPKREMLGQLLSPWARPTYVQRRRTGEEVQGPPPNERPTLVRNEIRNIGAQVAK